MTAADITTNPTGLLVFENVVLTLSNGETYTTKISKPYGALLTFAEAVSGVCTLSYVLSGRTFTVTAVDGGAGTSDKLVAMTIYGRK
jgi:hypothetical protein